MFHAIDVAIEILNRVEDLTRRKEGEADPMLRLCLAHERSALMDLHEWITKRRAAEQPA